MNLKSKIALAVLALSAGSAAMADLGYNVGVVSDYRVRGIAQTSEKAAVQAGIDYGFANGAYVGTWASNISWIKDFGGGTKGDYEIDVYGGYKGTFGASGLSYDIGLITYNYPGNDAPVDANTKEVYVAVTYGVATLKYNRSIGNFIGFADSDGSEYIDLSAGLDLGGGYSLTPHVGTQKVAKNSASDYSDYALTLAKDMGNGLSLSAAYMGTDAKEASYTDINGKFLGKSLVVLGAKYSF